MSVLERIRSGALARMGVLDDQRARDVSALLEQCEHDGLETLRFVFTDQHGILRGKTLTAEALPSAFANGVRVPSTLLLKDTAHRTVFPVWSPSGGLMQGASDVLLVPLPDSLTPLPWAPHAALIHCAVMTIDGAPIPFAPLHVLQTANDALTRRGLDPLMGLEVEFSVFTRGADGDVPLNPGYQYLTETRYAAHEDLLDLLRRTAQGMGLPVRSVEIEFGPGQFEFTFAPADPLTIARMAVTFRTMVKAVCQRQGLHASFMAKPRIANAMANGWHIHQSMSDAASGKSLFQPDAAGKMPAFAAHWVAGLLAHAEAACLLTTPTVNGYKRYAPYQLAPNAIGWGLDNRGTMIRAIMDPADPASRVENRVADSTANPYYALASQLVCGLDGVTNTLSPPAPMTAPYDTDARRLPTNLGAAIDAFSRSALMRGALGDAFVDYLTQLKTAEWDRYLTTISEWEQSEYFDTF